MMQVKWKWVFLVAAPLVVGTTVYAMAADGSPAVETSAAVVTTERVSAELLTQAELDALAGVQPAPIAEANASERTLDASFVEQTNPFVVTAAAAPASPAPPSTPAPAATTPVTTGGSLNLDAVKKLEFVTRTTQGELKLELKQEKEGFKLEGEWAGRKIEVKGEQALQVLNQLLQTYHLQDALGQALAGKPVTLDNRVLLAIEKLEVELLDGRKIESKGNNPKAEGRHDNGKHKGQEKKQDNDEDDDDDKKEKKDKKEKD